MRSMLLAYLDAIRAIAARARVHALLGVALLLLALDANFACAQAPALSRTQALQALTHEQAASRRQAAERLGAIGLMRDAAALVQTLRDADETTRRAAEQALWQIWSRSGNARVDKLYRLGLDQMRAGKMQEGIATFSRIIRIDPDFAEGWNKRATLYFLHGDYQRSLADCDEVIKRNPYHFGALAGYGQIYFKLEEYERAIEFFKRALEVNPNMESVRANIALVEALLERRHKNMI